MLRQISNAVDFSKRDAEELLEKLAKKETEGRQYHIKIAHFCCKFHKCEEKTDFCITQIRVLEQS